MRIVAITSKIDDIVTPIQAVIDSDPELRDALKGCRHLQGRVVAVFHDYRPYPIAVLFENGEVINMEQAEIEK